MRKLAGAALILLAAALTLRSALLERNRRRQTLDDLSRALRRLAEEIRLSRSPLPALLSRLAADCGPDGSAFFRGTALRLRRGEGLADVWRTAAASLPLDAADTRTLAELGPELRGDEARVCRAALSAADALAKRVEEMDAGRADDIRRAAALSFSAAALAVILLY